MKYLRSASTVLLSGAVLLGSSMICVGPTFAAIEPATQLALNWKPEPEFGGFYSAQWNGDFAHQSLQVEILPGGVGTPVVQMVAAGKTDFGIASADEVVIARSNGADVVAIFASYQTNPQCLMAHSERRFHSLQDIFASSGILAMQKGLPYASFLLEKFKNPKAQIVPYNGGISGLLSDPNYSQQCFIMSEPIAARQHKVSVDTFLVADVGYNPYTTVLITRGEVIRAKPELVRKFVTGVRAGWRSYLDHPDLINAKMAKLNPSMSAETFQESAKVQKPLIETEETKKNGLGFMSAKRWDDLSQQLSNLNLLKTKPQGMYRNF
jgi:NitT/TauT family transport system substrate-binding protein